ncbi:hypothetical protein [Leucobacter sp. cx-169]|uniref:hypothetical protein n=1 Tax=Leucobacter sp. cx-169 TaxID=2770549 RepID=UPI00165D4998|nr:hypothetical protein [Leucobacter sp. cx-169]MBC9927218.1 hypothetical protein [Leucobacter sp. cx-169]
MAKLRQVGISYRRIAELAEISESHVRNFAPTPSRPVPVSWVREALARRILAIPASVELAGDIDRVESRGAKRRLQALVARGWSSPLLAARLGMANANLHSLMVSPPERRIRPALHFAVAALYSELWNQNPPAASSAEQSARTRAINSAVKHGWVPPLAWDDIDIDPAPPEPETGPAEVDHVVFDLALAGQPVTVAVSERASLIYALSDAKRSRSEVAAVLGMTTAAVQARLQRRAA